MNSCVLMAEITSEPQLRYTQEGQVAITEMTVQFPGLRAEEPASALKVVGWGNLAEQIQSQYQVGDRVVLEGRLNMNTVERPEGFKEKRAELTISRIHLLGQDTLIEAPAALAATTTTSPAPATAAAPAPIPEPSAPAASAAKRAPAAAAKSKPAAGSATVAEPAGLEEPNYDEIPF